MILLYHHVKPEADDEISISLEKFTKHMLGLQDKTVVYLEDYNPLDDNQVVITFDDGYKSVLTYAAPVLKHFGYPFELFLVKDFYDKAQQGDEFFLNEGDLKSLMKIGGRLQYHTKSHPHLEEISDLKKLEEEIVAPEYMKNLDKNGFEWFAYPYCTYNDRVIEVVKKYYKGARSGKWLDGGTIYTLGSVFVRDDTLFEEASQDNEQAWRLCSKLFFLHKIKEFLRYLFFKLMFLFSFREKKEYFRAKYKEAKKRIKIY